MSCFPQGLTNIKTLWTSCEYDMVAYKEKGHYKFRWVTKQAGRVQCVHAFVVIETQRGRGSFSSVSARDGIVVLGQAYTHSSPSLSNLTKVALETVPMFVWLNTDRF